MVEKTEISFQLKNVECISQHLQFYKICTIPSIYVFQSVIIHSGKEYFNRWHNQEADRKKHTTNTNIEKNELYVASCCCYIANKHVINLCKIIQSHAFVLYSLMTHPCICTSKLKMWQYVYHTHKFRTFSILF